MEDKNLLGAVIAQAKVIGGLLADCDWLIGFANNHYSIGADGPCVHVTVDGFHEMFKSYLVKEMPGFEYHSVAKDGVTFYCLVDKEDEE